MRTKTLTVDQDYLALFAIPLQRSFCVLIDIGDSLRESSPTYTSCTEGFLTRLLIKFSSKAL